MHSFSNQHLISRLESLGAEVWLAPFTEWMFYINNLQMLDYKKSFRLKDFIYCWLVDRFMKKAEHKLLIPWQGYLKNLYELSVEKCLDYGSLYLSPAFRGEAILSVGKAVDFYHQRLSGVVNVLPFTCMPGTITSGILKRFQADHQGIPCINLSFDGQDDGGTLLRLEAFVYQCKEYQERILTKTV